MAHIVAGGLMATREIVRWGGPMLVDDDEREAPPDQSPPHDDADCPDDSLRADHSSTKAPVRFQFFTDLQLAARPLKAAVVEGILFADTLASIVAKWESFKTFLALELAFCVAVGADFNGRRTHCGAVIYVSAEGGAGLATRLAALRAKYGGFQGEIPLLIHPGCVLINQPEQVAALIISARESLAALSVYPPPVAAVVIDTIARNMSGNENAVEDLGAFVRGMDRLRQEFSCCVVAVHHAGWGAKGEDPRSRGSSALPAALDTEITMVRDDSQVTVKCTKQKDAARFADFTLEATPMAGSVVLMPVVPGSPKLTPNEATALKQVQDAPGLRSNPWLDVSGLPKGSFHNARKRLMTLAYVHQKAGVYLATDAGRLALSTRVNSGSIEVQL